MAVVAVDSADIFYRVPNAGLGRLTLYPPTGDTVAIGELQAEGDDTCARDTCGIDFPHQLKSARQRSLRHDVRPYVTPYARSSMGHEQR